MLGIEIKWGEGTLQIPAMTQHNSVLESVPTWLSRSKSPVLTATFQPGQSSFCVTSSGIEHPDCKFTAKGCTVLWDNGSSLRVSTALTMVSAA